MTIAWQSEANSATAAAQVKAICQGDEAQSRAEIQWWTKNAYNMSLKHCSDVHPARLVRMIVICLKFLDSYPNDGGIMHREDILRRKLNCLFLSVSASIVLGRSSENEEEAASPILLLSSSCCR